MSSRDECGSRIAESEIKKRGQREKRHRGLYYIDGTLIREGKKRTSLFRFADRFFFYSEFYFLRRYFPRYFHEAKGGGKARRPFIDNDGARRRKGESRVVERRRRERRANRNEKWRCRFRSRPLLGRGFPGCGAAESLDPSLVKSR